MLVSYKLFSLIICLKLSQAAVISSRIITGKREVATHDANIYALSSFLVWVILLVVGASSESHKWWSFYSSWIYYLAVEITLLGLYLRYIQPSHVLEGAQIGCQVVRITLLILLLVQVFILGSIQDWRARNDEESASLLGHTQGDSEATLISKQNVDYGTIEVGDNVDGDSTSDPDTDEEAKELKKEQEKLKRIQDRMRKSGNWVAYAREYLVSSPFLAKSSEYKHSLSFIKS